MLMCTLFEGGGGSEKVIFCHTHLNVDNYGRSLTVDPGVVGLTFQYYPCYAMK